MDVEETGDVSKLDLSPSAGRRLVLVAVLPTGEIAQYTLPADGAAIIGRAPGCAIHIDDPSVSRYHAEIAVGPAGPIVRDLHSHNGTFLNEQAVGDSFIGVLVGDALRFGSVSGQIHAVLGEEA